jgi:hypothetical protein
MAMATNTFEVSMLRFEKAGGGEHSMTIERYGALPGKDERIKLEGKMWLVVDAWWDLSTSPGAYVCVIKEESGN